MKFKYIIKKYLQSKRFYAKTINKGIREEKMPLLAKCLTIKTDKDEIKTHP